MDCIVHGVAKSQTRLSTCWESFIIKIQDKGHKSTVTPQESLCAVRNPPTSNLVHRTLYVMPPPLPRPCPKHPTLWQISLSGIVAAQRGEERPRLT